MKNDIDALIRRIQASTCPAVTTGELRMLQTHTKKIVEYEMLCGKLYKFEDKQLRLV